MFIGCFMVLKLVKVNSSDGLSMLHMYVLCIFLNAKSEGLVGLSPLFGDRRGFMPPQLKTNKTNLYINIYMWILTFVFFQVFDKDLVGSDDFMGEATIDLTEMNLLK